LPPPRATGRPRTFCARAVRHIGGGSYAVKAVAQLPHSIARVMPLASQSDCTAEGEVLPQRNPSRPQGFNAGGTLESFDKLDQMLVGHEVRFGWGLPGNFGPFARSAQERPAYPRVSLWPRPPFGLCFSFMGFSNAFALRPLRPLLALELAASEFIAGTLVGVVPEHLAPGVLVVERASAFE
jgi:hypothetical protein